MPPDREQVRRALDTHPDDAFALLLEDLGGPWNTRKAVRSGWRVFQRWLDESGGTVLGPVEARAYDRWLHREYRGVVASVNNRLSQARRLYTLLQALDLVDANPFAASSGQHNPAEQRRRRYSPAEVDALLDHAGPEDRVLVLLGAHAGLTGPEVCRLTWTDVDAERRAVQVRGRRSRTVPCTDDLHAALRALAQARGETPLLGQAARGLLITDAGAALTDMQLRARIFRACERAQVPYRAWQALRNHAAERFLAAYPRDQVMHLLGVGSPTALLPSIRLTARGTDDP